MAHAHALQVYINVKNPTVTSVDLGPLGAITLGLFTSDGATALGSSTINRFAVGLGNSTISALSTLQAPDAMNPNSPSVRFLANYLNGVAQPLLLRGTKDSTQIQAMKEAMAAFTTTTTVPGLLACLVTAFNVKLSISEFFNNVFPTSGIIVSPFSVEWAILATDCLVSTADGTTIGYWRGDYRAKPIVVGPKARVQTDFLNVVITQKVSMEFFNTVFHALISHDATMSVSGAMTVRIGQSFEMTFDWVALKVPTSIVS